MSLQHIVLRDFVIVRELDLDLSSGFSAVSYTHLTLPTICSV